MNVKRDDRKSYKQNRDVWNKKREGARSGERVLNEEPRLYKMLPRGTVILHRSILRTTPLLLPAHMMVPQIGDSRV
jgi:hypothetical protein